MKEVSISIVQADAIYKALYYVVRAEDEEIPNELTEIYEVLAEENPYDTYATDTVNIMEYLGKTLKDSEKYKEYFSKND
ncbi:putative membrane protein [Paenibacillus polymyxa]